MQLVKETNVKSGECRTRIFRDSARKKRLRNRQAANRFYLLRPTCWFLFIRSGANEKGLFHVQLEEKQYDERGRPEGWWRSYGTSSITDSKDKAEEIAQEEIRMHVGKDDLPASTGS